MCASIDDEDSEYDEELRLVAGDTHGLIAAKTVTDKDGEQVNIVCIRNPLGSFEWKGAWGDDSDKWTEELRKEVGFT